MRSPEEIVYDLLVRDIDGQVRDLENMRAHTGMAISAGGVAAAILSASSSGTGVFFWLGAVAFAVLVACTVIIYQPLDMRFSPADDGAVERYLVGEGDGDGQRVLRELAGNAEQAWGDNQDRLDRRWAVQRAAFVALALTVGLFLCHSVFDSQGSKAAGCASHATVDCQRRSAHSGS